MSRRSSLFQLWFRLIWPRPGDSPSPVPGPCPVFYESVPVDRYRLGKVDRAILDEAAEEAEQEHRDPKAFVPGDELARLLRSLNRR